MFSVVGKTVPPRHVRGRRPSFPAGTASIHLVHDFGFDGTRAKDILRFTDRGPENGAETPGTDPAQSQRNRVAAKPNRASPEAERFEP